MEIVLKIDRGKVCQSVSSTRLYTNMTTISAWLTNVYTKDEVDTIIENQTIWYVKQW